MPMHILIVEDNQKLADNIAAYLETEKYIPDLAYDGIQGLEKALKNKYAIIILDLNLPGADGLAICSEIRKANIVTPIIMLTARIGSKHAIEGLNLGADDYLGKPFDLDELLARIRALQRRQVPSKNPIVEVSGLVINTNTHKVKRGSTPIALAPKEYALLEFLIRNKGVTQDRTTIIEQVWGEESDMLFSQTVDVHVAYLRRKLGKNIIQTIPGVGYLFPN